MYNAGVYDALYYMCRNTCVGDTCNTYYTHIIHIKHHTCITGMAQLVM